MTTKIRGFEPISKSNLKVFKDESEVLLPLRGTKTSAGYDFYATEDLTIKPQEKVFFWTDIKAYMQDSEMLLLDIRSSIGTKQDVILSNIIPLIDSDYHNNPDNEGNIGISLRNVKPQCSLEGYERVEVVTESNPFTFLPSSKVISIPKIKDLTEENAVYIQKGERIAQGFFVEFKESDNCNTDVKRSSGLGSTNK